MAKTVSKSKQSYYALYKSTSRWASNRKRRLERELRRQPGNEAQIRAALGRISYRRGTPKTAQWSHSAVRIAKLFKMFSGQASHDLFSSNPKVQAQALQWFNTNRQFTNLPEGKVNFSLAARAHDKQGCLVWA